MPYDHRREVEAIRRFAQRHRDHARELHKEAEEARLKLLDKATAELAEAERDDLRADNIHRLCTRGAPSTESCCGLPNGNEST